MPGNRNTTLILERCDVGFDARLMEDGQIRWLQSMDGAVQTAVDLVERNRVVQPVMQSLIAALALHREPSAVLNLGMGGGALERAIRAARPNLPITSVELSANMVALAHKYFFVPVEHNVVIAAAEEFLQNCEHQYDLIFCDLFRGELQPECMGDPAFYRSLNQCLEPTGILAANIRFTNTDTLIELLLPLREALGWVAVYENAGFDNVTLFASRQAPENWQRLPAALEYLGQELAIDYSALMAGVAVLPRKLNQPTSSG